MVGLALDKTFRNFSTLFLLGAIFFVPLHIGHAFAFADELAVQELRADIETFPETKKVRGVGPAELERERTTLVVLAAIDMLVAVALFGAARRVHEIDAAGEVPTIGASLQGAASGFRGRPDPTVTAAGVIVGAAVAWLVYRIGMLVAEVLGAAAMFIGIGVARGIAASSFFAIAIGCAASAARAPQRPAAKLELY